MSGFILPRQIRQYRKPDYGNLIVIGDPALALGFREGSGSRTFDVSGNNFLGKLTNDVDANNFSLNPAWSVAQFGRQIVFNSTNKQLVKSDYPGVLGSNPRAVICIFRLDETLTQDNANIFSYGDETVNGGQWTFFLNNTPGAGTVGALRVGIAGGYNTANTPLDDGDLHVVGHRFSGTNVTDVEFYYDGKKDTISGSSARVVDTLAGRNVSIGKLVNSDGTARYSSITTSLFIFFDYAPRDEDMLRWTANPLTLFEPQRSWSSVARINITPPVITSVTIDSSNEVTVNFDEAVFGGSAGEEYLFIVNGVQFSTSAVGITSHSFPIKYGNLFANVRMRARDINGVESELSNVMSVTTSKSAQQLKAEKLTAI